MKEMTKRDIADIVLAVVGFVFILSLFQSFIYMGGIISTPSSMHFNQVLAFRLYSIRIFILFVFAWVLIFKRRKFIDLIFPQADKVRLNMDEEFADFFKYTFWIKLIGIGIFLFSVTKFVAKTVTTVPVMINEFVSSFFWWYECGPALVSSIIAAIVIWKAGWIARFIEGIGQPGKTKGTK